MSLNQEYKSKKVLITGGLGMIGSSIARKLVGLGSTVTIADAMMDKFGANNFNIREIRNKVKVHLADIRDKKVMLPLIEDCDIIFNFAGQVSHNDSLEDPFFDTELNYLGHMNVLEIVKEINPRIRLIYAGSRMQYGRVTKIPVSEVCPLRPLSPYALNKAAAENLYLFYNRVYGIPVVCFRITNPFGPGGQVKHSKYGIINSFIRLALENKNINIYGKGNQIRDYIFIEDLANALIISGVERGIEGEVFNVGSGLGKSFLEMAETIVETIGAGRLYKVPWPKKYINIETGDFIADISKIKSALSWTPKVSFDEGIKATCDHYRKYINYYL